MSTGSAGNNRNSRADLVKAELACAAEAYRCLLDHDKNLTQVIFIVQFLADGRLRRTIVKPESYLEAPRMEPKKIGVSS